MVGCEDGVTWCVVQIDGDHYFSTIVRRRGPRHRRCINDSFVFNVEVFHSVGSMMDSNFFWYVYK